MDDSIDMSTVTYIGFEVRFNGPKTGIHGSFSFPISWRGTINIDILQCFCDVYVVQLKWASN